MKRKGLLNKIILYGSQLSLFLLLPPPGFSQNLSVFGITLGMTVPEAMAKLSGYTLAETTLKVSPIFKFYKVSRGAPIGGNPNDMDTYYLETVNGKIESIQRDLHLPRGKEVEMAGYEQQLLAKFGKPSPGSGGRVYEPNSYIHLVWQYDGAGHLIPYNFVNTDSNCPAALAVPDGSGWVLYQSVPTHPDIPPCHVRLKVNLDRSQGTTPSGAFDDIYVTLIDPQPFIAFTLQQIEIAKQRQKAAQNQLHTRQGPPM